MTSRISSHAFHPLNPVFSKGLIPNGIINAGQAMNSMFCTDQSIKGGRILQLNKLWSAVVGLVSTIGLQRSFLLMAISLVMGGTAWAQDTGSLLGVVSDQNGAVVPSATVQATNTDTGLITTTRSSSEGSYLIPLLSIGHYKISVEASGFKKFVRTDVLVPVSQNIRVDVKLEIGQVAQTISVTGNAVNIDTTSATLGATVDTAHLQTLPLNGRNAMGLLTTLPGVASATAPTYVTFARSGPAYSISGSRTDFGNLMLDGTTLTDAIDNESQNLPTVDALEEFRVLTNSYGADYGRAAGSVIVAVTKSGTNQFHGSAWEYIRNDAFDAANAFTPVGTRKPLLRQNQFGGDLGGPVLLPKYNGRSRSFFFVSYQGLQIHQQSLTVAYPLTAAERGGNFSALLPSQVIKDPNTGLPFTGNMIPSNRIDTVATTVMNLYMPLPNQPADNSLRLSQAAPVTNHELVVKIDQALGANDRVFFRLYRTSSTSETPNSIPFFLNPGNGNFQSYALSETHIFSPNLINQAEASYSRPLGVTGTELNGESAKQLGINANGFTPYPQTPYFSATGDFSFGTDYNTKEPSYFRQFNDTLSLIHGKHDLRAGFLFMYEGNGDLAYPSTTLSFTGLFTGNPMADFLIGRPQTYSVETTIIDNGTSKQFQPFIQDDYKVAKNLTLNLGLRYAVQTPWTEKAGNASTFVAGQQSTVFPSAPPGLVVPGDKGVPLGLYNTYKLGFEPRIGLAWDITGGGQTSLRAGWGLYHSAINEEVEAIETNNEPFLVSFSNTPANTENPWAGTTDPLPYNPKNPSFGPFPGITQSHVDPNYRPADVQQFNLNIQHRFGGNIFAEVAYVGGQSRHLYDSRELNAAVFGPGATEANAQSRRPILPQYYGSISGLFSEDNANYNGLQANLQKRLSKSYAVQVAYTWERSIDDRSQSLLGSGPQNPSNWLSGERGPSDFNVGQILAINGLWDLPSLKGRGVLTAVAGGWQLTGIFRYNGGTPGSVVTGQDNALIGSAHAGAKERANINGNPNLSMSRSRSAIEAEYFNTAAFSIPAAGQFGTVRRNTNIGPGNLQNDMAIMKKIPVFPREMGGFEIRADMFNVINWTNLGQPNRTLTSASYGKITSAGDPRIAQFALRYDF